MDDSKKDVLILFGGESAEHEVSIITGLQIVENIDREKFIPHVIYVHKNGILDYKGILSNRRSFSSSHSADVEFGLNHKGGYFSIRKNLGSRKIFPDAAYMAFHGGGGEGGSMQGLLESFHIPQTSPSYESSVITMNKHLTKIVFEKSDIPTLKYTTVVTEDLKDIQSTVRNIQDHHGLPVIVKPAHLGSSIGIHVAKTSIELEKALRIALFMDSVILVEPFISSFVEYNISVRSKDSEVELSPIEKPVSQDQILSFSDKYERGSKKSGAKGMASLDREIPANLAGSLQRRIEDIARKAYRACYCTGLVRIDFMVDTKDPENPYITEINSIPGSMAFYIWEASGLDFESQITHAFDDAVYQFKTRNDHDLAYDTKIVEKFISQ